MRKAIFLNIAFFLLASSITTSIYAHPGRTAADGCHYCRTSCDKWGVPWNERHCHGGSGTQEVQESKPIYKLPTNTPILLPTWTPIPTRTPTPTITSSVTPKSKTKKITKSTKIKTQKKSFWQWLFGK